MNEAIGREKRRIALRQYVRYFALGEEAQEKTHTKHKVKERTNSSESIKAALKVKNKLKGLLKKARKNTFPLAFRNYEEDEFMDSVVVLQHYKGKTIDKVMAELLSDSDSGTDVGDARQTEAVRRARLREKKRVRRLLSAAKDVLAFGSVLEAAAMRMCREAGARGQPP